MSHTWKIQKYIALTFFLFFRIFVFPLPQEKSLHLSPWWNSSICPSFEKIKLFYSIHFSWGISCPWKSNKTASNNRDTTVSFAILRFRKLRWLFIRCYAEELQKPENCSKGFNFFNWFDSLWIVVLMSSLFLMATANIIINIILLNNMSTLINSYYFYMLRALAFVSLYESVWQYMNVNVKFITLNFNGLQLKPCSTENSGTKKKCSRIRPAVWMIFHLASF